MKVTREKVIALWGLFDRLLGQEAKVKFHYAIRKNRLAIKNEVEVLQEVRKPSESFLAFERKRIDLCEECSTKEDGRPKRFNGEYVIDEEHKEKFESELLSLRESHSKAIEEREAAQKEFLKMLQEEVEIDFYRFSLDIMPETLLGRDADLLFDLLEEDQD